MPAEPSVQYATPLWRALIGLRIVTLAYATTLVIHNYRTLARPVTALVALAAMVMWTAVMSVANGRHRSRRWRWSVADLAVATGMLLLTGYIDGPSGLLAHSLTLTGQWTAAPVLSCAVLGGPWLGLLASSAIAAATIALPGTWWDADTLDNLMILASAAAAVGLVARLLQRTQDQLRRLVAQQAAAAERDRLARQIHDGVLQLLALLERDGPGLGERGAQLASLAGTQQAALRALMSGEPAPDAGKDRPATLDLRAVLAGLAAPDVQLGVSAGARRTAHARDQGRPVHRLGGPASGRGSTRRPTGPPAPGRTFCVPKLTRCWPRTSSRP
jgi:hypothetical protein